MQGAEGVQGVEQQGQQRAPYPAVCDTASVSSAKIGRQAQGRRGPCRRPVEQLDASPPRPAWSTGPFHRGSSPNRPAAGRPRPRRLPLRRAPRAITESLPRSGVSTVRILSVVPGHRFPQHQAARLRWIGSGMHSAASLYSKYSLRRSGGSRTGPSARSMAFHLRPLACRFSGGVMSGSFWRGDYCSSYPLARMKFTLSRQFAPVR